MIRSPRKGAIFLLNFWAEPSWVRKNNHFLSYLVNFPPLKKVPKIRDKTTRRVKKLLDFLGFVVRSGV